MDVPALIAAFAAIPPVNNRDAEIVNVFPIK